MLFYLKYWKLPLKRHTQNWVKKMFEKNKYSGHKKLLQLNYLWLITEFGPVLWMSKIQITSTTDGSMITLKWTGCSTILINNRNYQHNLSARWTGKENVTPSKEVDVVLKNHIQGGRSRFGKFWVKFAQKRANNCLDLHFKISKGTMANKV